MIVTQAKDKDELLKDLSDYQKIFIVGCSECATECKTGGEDEIAAMKEFLESNGKTVTGSIVATTGCQVLLTKRELKAEKDNVEDADCMLGLSCGAGAQTLAELVPDVPTVPGNDTVFLGNVQRLGMFDERCSICGHCVLSKTGGICPMTRCSKGLLNGPCGGALDGKCEVDSEKRCAWLDIYERLKSMDMLDKMKDIIPPQPAAGAQPPRDISLREKRERKKKPDA